MIGPTLALWLLMHRQTAMPTDAFEPPRVAAFAPAPYTEAALRARIQGTVAVRVTIDQAGRVTDAQVSGRGLPMGLSDKSVTAARAWRFNRSPVSQRAAILEFVFSLSPKGRPPEGFEFEEPYTLQVWHEGWTLDEH